MLCGLLVLWPGGAVASPGPEVGGAGQAAFSASREIRVAPPAFRLARFDAVPFLEARRRLQGRLAAAMAGGGPDTPQTDAEIGAILDLAELHLAHVMVPEGLSYLAALDDVLPPEDAMRRAALELVFGVLDTRHDPAMTDRAKRLLGDAYEGWDEQPLMLALHHAGAGRMEAAGPHLAQAEARLSALSAPMHEAVLPLLLDAAVATSEWQTAQSLAMRISKLPRLAEAPAYRYLLGRTAEAGEDILAAFDHYRAASAGADAWAHRARMALVEMGLRTETLDRHDARALLAQARRRWSGDQLEIDMLQRIVRLDLELDDPVSALEVLATLISRQPEAPEAALARQQARSLWSDFYDRGAEGELSLSSFLRGHRSIAPDYRFQPGFDVETEQFADRFLAEGATQVAADEYGAIHDYLLVSQDLGLSAVEDARLDALRLKRAEALIRGGQLDEAAHVLAAGIDSDDPRLTDRLNLLEARLHAERGEADGVVETRLKLPSTDYLRLKARAHFDREHWAEAQGIYAQILERKGDEMPFGDAINMLLATYRAGDKATTLALANRFPDLTRSEQWAHIARGLTEAAPDVLPLREAAARAGMEQARTTLETLERLDRPEGSEDMDSPSN